MKIHQHYSLKDYNTFGIDETAQYFVSIESIADLQSVLSDPEWQDVPKMILGGGSNMLLTKPVSGLVMHVNLKGRSIFATEKDEDQVVIEAMAGENWHDFVLWTLAQGFGGLENLALIPGNVGTSPIQNIGAYGVEIKDRMVSLQAIEIATGEIREFANEECQFGYRDSIFKRELKGKYIVLSVRFLLTKKDHQLNTSYGAIETELAGLESVHPRDVAEAVIAIRQRKLPDPAEIGNSGSFFKNPVVSTEKFAALKKNFPDMRSYPLDTGAVKIPAAYLIDQCGWKGYREGHVGVHENQPLVLVNFGGGLGQQIYDLSEKILISVREKFGIELEREVNVI